MIRALVVILLCTQPNVPDKESALTALRAARRALAAETNPALKEEASRSLKEAESLFESAEYAGASRAADQTWRVLQKEKAESSKFSVDVGEDGKTRIEAGAGAPVRVEAQGKSQSLYSGDALEVQKGEAPGSPETPPPSPFPLKPDDGQKLKLRVVGSGLGPVVLSWKQVEDAAQYEIQLVPKDSRARPLNLKSERNELRVPPLAAGKYAWTVRAVGPRGSSSPPSSERSFEVAAETIKLEVKGTQWK